MLHHTEKYVMRKSWKMDIGVGQRVRRSYGKIDIWFHSGPDHIYHIIIIIILSHPRPNLTYGKVLENWIVLDNIKVMEML